MMKAKWTGLVVVVVAVSVGPAAAVNIETVTIGNPGNAADTRYETPGYGAVDYAYDIGKFEVTAGDYTEFLNSVAGVDEYGLYSDRMWSPTDRPCGIERFFGTGTQADPYQYRVATELANRPVNFVTYWNACRFANWLENGQPTGLQGFGTTETGAYTLTTDGMNNNTITREPNARWAVPSEDEWYKAAFCDGATGTYYNYPTSSNSRPSNALGHPTDPGNNATFYDNGYTIGSPYWRTEMGAHENSDTPYGTFDQGGNVWEWNEVIQFSNRGLRGGSNDQEFFSLQATARYDGHTPTNEHHGIGFRVVEVPEPASASIVFLGAVALLRRRKK